MTSELRSKRITRRAEDHLPDSIRYWEIGSAMTGTGQYVGYLEGVGEIIVCGHTHTMREDAEFCAINRSARWVSEIT